MMGTIPPYSPDALRDVLARHGLSGSKAGRLLRVDGRTVRRWTGGMHQKGRQDMPESTWLLLLILTGEASVAQVLAAAESCRSASSMASAAVS